MVSFERFVRNKAFLATLVPFKIVAQHEFSLTCTYASQTRTNYFKARV